MKITTHNKTGAVVLYPATEPTPRPNQTIRVVESIPEGNGPLLWDHDAGQLIRTAPPPIPLRTRLKSVIKEWPPKMRAGFPFEKVSYWLEEGDEATAREIIDSLDVTGRPKIVQDTKAAILAEFDAEVAR